MCYTTSVAQDFAGAPMGGKKDRLVFIGFAHDEVEANIWRDVLAKDGIPSFVRSVDPLSPFGVTPLPGSFQLFVQERDEKRARWLLGQLAGEAAPDEER